MFLFVSRFAPSSQKGLPVSLQKLVSCWFHATRNAWSRSVRRHTLIGTAEWSEWSEWSDVDGHLIAHMGPLYGSVVHAMTVRVITSHYFTLLHITNGIMPRYSVRVLRPKQPSWAMVQRCWYWVIARLGKAEFLWATRTMNRAASHEIWGTVECHRSVGVVGSLRRDLWCCGPWPLAVGCKMWPATWISVITHRP